MADPLEALVDQALGATPEDPLARLVEDAVSAPDPSSLNGYDDLMTGTVMADQAIGEHNATAPELPEDMLSQGPAEIYPPSVGEAVVAAGKRGLRLKYAGGLFEDIESAARLSAQAFIASTGGSRRNVDDRTYQKVVAAYRWIHTSTQSEMADEEKTSVLRAAGDQALAIAMDRGMGRLTALDQRLEDPNLSVLERNLAEVERDQVRTAFAHAQSWRSLLAEGNAHATHKLREYIRTSMLHDEQDGEQDSLALRQLNDVLLPKTITAVPDLNTGARAHRPAMAIMPSAMRTLLSSGANPTGARQVFKLAAQSALQRTRAARLGVTPEEIDSMGTNALLFKAYPQLAQNAIVQATSELPPGGISAAAVDEGRTVALPSGLVRDVLRNIDTAAEKLARFDPGQTPVEMDPIARAVDEVGGPAARGIGEMFMGALALGSLATKAITATRRNTTQAYGWSLKPWELAPIDRERVRQGIEAGEVDIGAALRVAGMEDDWVAGWVLTAEHLGTRLISAADQITSVGGPDRGVAEELDGDFIKGLSPDVVAELVGDFVKRRGASEESDTLGIGKIVAEKLQGLPESALTPETMRAVLDAVKTELIHRNPVVAEIRDLDKEYFADAARAQKGNSFTEQLYTTTKAALFRTVVTDTAEIMTLLADDPSRAPGLAALAGGANAVGGRVFGNIHDSLNKGLASITERGRLRRALKDLAYFDADAAENVARAHRNHPVPGLTETKNRAISTVAQKLADEAKAELRDVKRLTTADHTVFQRGRRKKVRELDRLLAANKVDPADTLDIMGMPEELIKDIQSPVRAQFLNDVVTGVLDKVGLRGHSLSPFAQARARSNVFKQINDLLDEGADLAQIKGVKAPMVGTQEGYRNWFRAMKDRLGGPRLDWETTSLTAAAAQWAKEAAPAVTALRDYNVLIQGRQHDLLDVALRRLDNDEAVLGQFVNLEPGIEKNLRRIQRNRELLTTALNEVQSRGWREAVRLSGHDALLDTLTFTDLRTWWEAAQGPGARHQLWTAHKGARSADGTLIPPREFFEQMDHVARVEEAALSGQLTGTKRKHSLRWVGKQKREFVRTLFDREIPETFLQAGDAFVFDPNWVHKVDARRTELANKIANAADPIEEGEWAARLNRLPKVVTQDLPTQIQRAQELAQTIAAQDFDAVAGKMNGWDFARPAEVGEYMRQLAISSRGKLVSQMLKAQHFFEEYHRLSPALRNSFDDMLGKAGRGEYRSWQEFFEEHPDLRARFSEGGEAENMGRAFENMEGVRTDLLAELHRLGRISDEAYENYARPYSPQLYSVDEFPHMLGKAARKRVEQQIKQGRSDFDPAVQEADAFELQRDIYQTRLLIQQRGSEWLDKRFDSRMEAHRYVADRYGLRAKSAKPLEGTSGVEARTGLGDRYVVLDPLGENHAAQLGLLGRGAALGARAIDLMRMVPIWQVHKAFDRPGFMLTQAEWNLAQRTPAGKRMTKNFIEIPKKSSLFEPIAGKFVHKDVAINIQRALHMQKMADDMAREFTEAAITDVPNWAGGLSKIASWLHDHTVSIRQLIGTNGIERFGRTHLMNRVTDSQIFAPAAAGRSYLTSPKGKQAQRWARQFLLGREGGKGGIFESFNATKSLARELDKLKQEHPQLGQWVEDAARGGMLGDSMLGTNPVSADAYKSMTEAFFGESAEGIIRSTSAEAQGAPARRAARLARVESDLDGLAEDLRNMTASDPKFEKVNQLASRLEGEKLALQAAIDLEPTKFHRRLDEAVGWFLGTRTKRGTFDEHRNYSHSLYQREGNIHRLGAYLHARQLGHSHEYAINRVRTFMQDYSNIRGAFSLLRDLPVANPIMSFPIEMVRILKNQLLQSPGMLLGWLAAAPMMSAPALMMTGIDPVEYYMARGQGNIVDAAVHATSTLITPSVTGDGVDEWQAPQLGALQLLQKSTGMEGALTKRTEEVPGAAGVLGGLGLRVAGQYFGNPAMDALYTLTVGKDAISHEKIGGGFFGAIGHSVQEVARLFVPGSMPWFGSVGRTNMDALRYPPRPGTGRIDPPIGRLLYSLTGIRHTGSALDYVDIAAGGPLAYSTKLALDAMNIATFDDLPVPETLPRGRSIGDEDLAVWMFYANRKNGLYPEGFGRGQFEHLEERMSFAGYMEAHAEKTGDTALLGWAQRERVKTVKQLEKELNAHPQFRVVGVPDEVMQREGEKLLKGEADRANFDETFAEADLIHQVTSLLTMSAAGIKDDVMSHLAHKAVMQTGNDPEDFRGWSDPAVMQVALEHIRQHFETRDPRMTGDRALRIMQYALTQQLPSAYETRTRKILSDEENTERFKRYRELKHGEQEGDFDE